MGVDVSLGGGNDLFDKFDYDYLVLVVGSGVNVSGLFHMDTVPTSTVLMTTLECCQKHYQHSHWYLQLCPTRGHRPPRAYIVRQRQALQSARKQNVATVVK